MEVIFYDRKHHREIKASELMKIKLSENKVGSNEDQPDPTKIPEFGELRVRSEVVGTIAYKSDKCHSYCNWDNWLNEEDLIFLRLEE